jgi:hypothetical protein
MGRDHLGEIGISGKIMECEVSIGFSWFKVWSSDELLRAWY